MPAGGSVTITFTATVNAGHAGDVLSAQGTVSYDSDGDLTNETTALTDDPGVAGAHDANIIRLPSVVLAGTQTVAGVFVPSGAISYTILVTNSGNSAQADNPGHEFTETLGAGLVLNSANATSGTAVATPGTGVVTWDGAIPAAGSVTITISATIDPATAPGTNFAVQGTLSFDHDVDGTNEATVLTDTPPLGNPPKFTSFVVRDPHDYAFITGAKAADFNVLTNDHATGVTLSVTGVTQGLYGAVTFSANGIIHYAPNAKLPAGGDTFTYTVSDGHGGSYTASVTVRDFSETAATYNGLISPSIGVAEDNSQLGLIRVTVTSTGSFTGSLTIGGFKFALNGALETLGSARFGRTQAINLTLIRKPPHAVALPALLLSFQIDPELDQVAGSLTESGNAFAQFAADRAFYTAKHSPIPPLLPVPPAILGKYTVLFPPEAAPNNGYTADQYPQGNGFARLTVAVNGLATITGKLADGTTVSYGNALSKSNTWPFYLALYSRAGSLSGTVNFRDNAPTMSDIDGIGLEWFRPVNSKAKTYPNGWPNGILVDLIGSFFELPPQGVSASVLPGLDGNGDADVDFTGGDLVNPISLTATVSTKNKVVFVSAPSDLHPKLTIAATGLVSGSFIHPVSKKPTAIKGVVFQKQSRAAGYFLGPTQSGSIDVAPH